MRWDRFDTGFNSYSTLPPPAGGTSDGEYCSAAPGGVTAYVPRGAGVQAEQPWEHVLRLWDELQSFGRVAEFVGGVERFAAGENQTFELGAKYSLLGEHLLLDAALFRTEKDNARETDPTNSNNVVLAGNQLVKGVQFSAVGRLPQGLDLLIRYAYLNSAVIYSQLYPASVGYPLANVPKQTFNFFLTHPRLPLRLTAGLGGNYVASRTASSTVPFTADL